jgi:cysteine desulfurase
MQRPIYLDYNATTPVDPAVLEAMLPFLRENFGNASSTEHSYGWQAAKAVEIARISCAKIIGATASSIVFTSGATEANNLALLGVLRPFLREKSKPHLVTTAVEHKAVLDVAHALEKEGVDVTYLPVDEYGRVTAAQVKSALTPATRMVSVMFGQNEIGSINPIGDIGALLPDDVIFHVDAAQTVGKMPIDVSALGVDLLSASGHKFYAPKGIGFLYVARNVEVAPQLFGGGQEHGLRPGTLNVASIVALGKAAELCLHEMSSETDRLRLLRDEFIARIKSALPTVRLNGHPTERLVSNMSFTFDDLSADIFALGLPGIAVSAGSACAKGATSHVLKAIGLDESHANATLRIGIGRFTTANDLDIAFARILDMVKESERRRN